MNAQLVDWMCEGLSAGFILPRAKPEWHGPIDPLQVQPEPKPVPVYVVRKSKCPRVGSKDFFGPTIPSSHPLYKRLYMQLWRDLNLKRSRLYHKIYMRERRKRERQHEPV